MSKSPFELFHLGLSSNSFSMISTLSDAEFINYFAGVFKQFGTIDENKCSITLSDEGIINKANSILGIPCFMNVENDKYTLEYTKSNAIDLVDTLFKGESKLNHFPELKIYKGCIPICRFIKTRDNAIEPSKSRDSDVGYDLTIIAVKKVINKKTVLYTTGICIDIDHGYYTEIVPRSSIIKSGYMLANSIGIIENSYRGELMIALTKIDEDSPDIELPFKCCQLIIRKQHYAIFREEEVLDKSLRNDGGFGSTGR